MDFYSFEKVEKTFWFYDLFNITFNSAFTAVKKCKVLRDLSEISRGEGGGNFKFGFGNEVTHPCNGSEIC